MLVMVVMVDTIVEGCYEREQVKRLIYAVCIEIVGSGGSDVGEDGSRRTYLTQRLEYEAGGTARSVWASPSLLTKLSSCSHLCSGTRHEFSGLCLAESSATTPCRLGFSIQGESVGSAAGVAFCQEGGYWTSNRIILP
jgi:hypothetical protein